MKKVFGGLAVIGLLCAAANAATVNTTLTITGSATSASGNITVAGNAAFAGGLTGTGTLNTTFSLTTVALSGAVPITVAITTGATTGTLTGTLTASAALLIQVLSGNSSVSGTGTIAFTSGTGGFNGATGTFTVTAAGTGAGTTGSGAGTFSLSGPGTLNIGGTVGPPVPTVTAVWDAASNTPGLAQGSIFIIKGSTLCPSGSTFFTIPRPTVTPDGVKITFTPTAGGAATNALIWYEYNPSGVCQLAGILPSTVAPGSYNVTVTNGTTSAALTTQVVQSKISLFTQDSSGSGLVVGQNFISAAQLDINRLTTGTVSGTTISPAHPGQSMIVYGTGLGPLVGGDNAASPIFDFSTNGFNVKAVVGGVTIPVAFAGRAGYAGEDQLNFTLPANVPTGCSVNLQISVNGVLSSPTSLAIAPVNATECVQPGFTAAQLKSFDQGGTFTVGSFSLSQLQETIPTFGTVKINSAGGLFTRFSAFQLAGASQYTSAATGACNVIHAIAAGSTPTVASATGLDAGTVTLNGPNGSNISNMTFKQDATTNAYSLLLATDGLPVGGGTGSIVAGQYTIAGAGGKDVGKFNSSLTVGTPINLVGGIPASVNRSAGLPLTWTGGNANDLVEIIGLSSSTTGTGATATTDTWEFICTTTAGAGTFTVPSSVLLQLPAVSAGSTTGTGFLEFASSVTPSTFTASLSAGGSIDNGSFLSLLGIAGQVAFQ